MSQLEQVARAMGLKNLPKKVSGFREGDNTQQRQLATSGIAAKLRQWKDNVRADKKGTFQTSPVPGDMSLFASVVPEVAELRRGDFPTNAAYQNAVRDALPSQSEVRKRLTAMDDATLAQTAQLLGVKNLNYATEQSEGVDTAALRSAVEQTKMRGQGASRNTVAEAFPAQDAQPRPRALPKDDDFVATPDGVEEGTRSFGGSDRMASLLRRATESDVATPEYTARNAEGIAQAASSPTPPRRRPQVDSDKALPADADPFAESDGSLTAEDLGVPDDNEALKKEAIRATGATALYAYLTGQTSGPGFNVVRDTFMPPRPGVEMPRINAGLLDGAAIFRNILANNGTTSEEAQQAAFDNFQQLALDSPRAFAENLPITEDVAAFVASNSAPARFETASASGVSNTRVQERGEQEASDSLFFGQHLEGARFVRNESGAYKPVREPNLAGTSPEDRQRVKSTERTRRLKGRNLTSLEVRTVLGVEQYHAFDAIALAEYGQSGLPAAADARTALLNLKANLQRMINGPESSALLPGGERPSFVQSLRSDYFINDDTVIFEGSNATVTYGEALQADMQALGDTQEAARLGNELEALNEQQSALRKALTQLVGRIANGLDNVAPDVRAATLLDIGDVIRNINSMPGDTGDRVAGLDETTQQLRAFNVRDKQTLAADMQKHLDKLKAQRREYTEPSSAEHTNPIQMATEQSELAYRELQELENAPVSSAAAKAREAELDMLRGKYEAHLDTVNRAKQSLQDLNTKVESAERTLGLLLEGKELDTVSTTVDLSEIDRRKSIAGRYTLNKTEAERMGLRGWSHKGNPLGVDIDQDLGGATSFRVLADRYSAGIARAKAINNRLGEIGRVASDKDIGVDIMASQLMAEGYQYDDAYAEAEKLVEVAFGTSGQEATTNSRPRIGDETGPEYIPYGKFNEPVRGDFDAEGRPQQAYINEAGEMAMAEMPTSDDGPLSSDEADPGVAEVDPLEILRTVVIPNRARARALRQQVENYKAVGGKVERIVAQKDHTMLLEELYSKQASLRKTWVDGDATYVFQNTRGFASPAHKEAFQKHQARKRVQSVGTPLPETPRADILNAAFGESGFRVIGSADPTAVESFVAQAVNDFRSTGRPVMITVGESADQISQHIQKHRLLDEKQRKTAVAELKRAQAGKHALYMPMGDFVLVSLPPMPKRGRAANIRWYHQLGHELGHMVFDDYATSLASNRTHREALYAAFTSQTELDPMADPSLFKEWFADQAANEMITRALGMATNGQVTPFTRLAELMRGLWSRIQHLLPRFTRTRSFAQFANAIREGQIAASRGLLTRAEINARYSKFRSDNRAEWADLQAQLADIEAGYKKGTATRNELMNARAEVSRSRKQIEQRVEAAKKRALKSRLLERTADFTIENYDGPTQADVQQAQALNIRMKAFAKKHTAPGTVAEAGGRLVRTVIGRIESYNMELAKRLFPRSATDMSSKGIQGWQQMTNSARDRWTGQMERTFEEVYKAAGIKGAFKGKEKEAALREAFRDFEMGRTHKKGAAALARAVKAITSNARQNGFRSTILDGNRPPVAMDHFAVDKDRQAFSALMREAYPQASEKELSERLNLLLDNHGQSEFAIAPGLPVSYHDTTRHMVDVLGTARLREAGFLAEPSEAVFYHFIDGLAKRTAWEANFGGYTRQVSDHMAENRKLIGRDDPNNTLVNELGLARDGRYFDPNGEFHLLMEEVAAQHGTEAVADIRDMLDGVMGRKTSRMPRGLRNVNDWVTAWVSWTVLAFSGIASIPEIGLPAVRAHGRVGLLEGIRGFGEARRFAKAAGNVLSDGAERIMWQSMGDSYESSTLNKIGTAFFKYNGQKVITDVSRAMGISFGIRYLINSAEVGDTQALAQLGVTPDDVRAWDQAGRPVWSADADSATNATAEKVQAALTQFMYEGSSYPSKFQNPGWFNNPYLKAFWMIKRYMYAYGEGILMGMWRQAKRQWVRGQGLRAEQKAFMVAAPFMAFAIATIPLAMLGTEIREWMRPLTSGRQGKDIDDYGGVAGYSQYLFSRAGGFGPLEMVLSARQQSDWGYSPLGSVSPVFAKMEMLLDWGADASFGEKALDKTRQMLPIANQFPGVWNKIVP
ncbi:hypothetical protein [Halomonas sp. 707B3]|uniref:hypothetical protein n=1 Tax=Halomonas sp. 707B3 TaxID=1681043 RepID=UPI0020A20BA4|nr:hypothetical protein [Halomonas sp. 707B3]MCP1319308.1 hypothetical protein [Halomonas sp. 707B3]